MAYVSQKNRDIKPFVWQQDINPQYFRKMRVDGRVTGDPDSRTNIIFEINRPDPSYLLYAHASIQWDVSIQRRRLNDEEPVNFPSRDDAPNEEDFLYLKPFCMSNTMDDITVSYNGYGVQYARPTIWSKYVHQVTATQDHMEKKFSLAGGPFPTYHGSYDFQSSTRGIDDDNTVGLVQDTGITLASDRAHVDTAEALGNSPDVTFRFLEPLMVSLFSPYEEHHTLPRRSMYKKMGWAIPHVDQLKVEVNLNKIAANMLVYPYALMPPVNGDVATAMLLSTTGVEATLLVTWVRPHKNYVVPRVIDLPSWNVQPFTFPIEDEMKFDTEFQLDTRQIVLQQVPSSILMFGSLRKDVDFECISLHADDDGENGNETINFEESSVELNLTMTDMRIRVDVNNELITTEWSELELMQITERNCNEMPFDFSAYVGGPNHLGTNQSNAFAYFYPDDLRIQKSPGLLKHRSTFQVEGTLTAKPGYGFSNGLAGEDPAHKYDFHVVFFFDNYAITLEQGGRVSANYLAGAL